MPLYSHPAEIRDNGWASCKSGHTEYIVPGNGV